MVEYYLGDLVKMRKSHPCGGDTWEVTRIGMDFRIRCATCGHSLLLPRAKFEKSVKSILSRGDALLTAQQRPAFTNTSDEKKEKQSLK